MPSKTVQISREKSQVTRDRILDAAENLFADHGIDGTSLRRITAKAGVNLAAVNYHFRTKDDLAVAVLSRRASPLNLERLRLLEEAEKNAAGQPAPLEKILEALIRPAMLMSHQGEAGHRILRLMGRMASDPNEIMNRIIIQEFQPMLQRFKTAVVRTLPHLPPEEIWWRLHFTVGAMIHTIIHLFQIEKISQGLCQNTDLEGSIQRLIQYTANGLRAPIKGKNLMYHIALKMLLGDRAKYIMLIGGLTFSSLLMTQQSSVFCGLMRWTTATVRNVRAAVWVVDPKVEQVNEVKAMRDTDLERVRSVAGIKWAVPLYSGVLQVRLSDGSFKTIQMLGLDSSTLFGAPQITQGRLENIFQTNSVIVDQVAVERFSNSGRPIQVGDSLDINDQEARIVAIAKTQRSFTGLPYVFATFERAVQYAPHERKMLSFVLAEPTKDWTPERLARQIEKETGLKAYTKDELFWSTIWWYIRNTGIPISFGTTVLLGIIVGIAIAGQTFYSFVLENVRNLGALKAMGVTDSTIARMLMLQAFTVGFIGYGCGVGLAALFGHAVSKHEQPPFFMPPHVLVGSFAIVVLICGFAALLGIFKMSKIEPAMVFRT